MEGGAESGAQLSRAGLRWLLVGLSLHRLFSFLNDFADSLLLLRDGIRSVVGDRSLAQSTTFLAFLSIRLLLKKGSLSGVSTSGVGNGLHAFLTSLFETRTIIHIATLGSHTRVVTTVELLLTHVGSKVTASNLTRLLALAVDLQAFTSLGVGHDRGMRGLANDSTTSNTLGVGRQVVLLGLVEQSVGSLLGTRDVGLPGAAVD